MSWMRMSQLPYMAALRETHAKAPMKLFGPSAIARSRARSGRKGAASRLAVRFAAKILPARRGENEGGGA